MKPLNTLGKYERIKSRKMVQALFEGRQQFALFPFRVAWLLNPDSTSIHEPLQAAFSVGKRYFKRANRRNRIRRQIKEAYRLRKAPLQQILLEKQLQFRVFISYTGNEMPDYKFIEEKMQALMHRLEKITLNATNAEKNQ